MCRASSPRAELEASDPSRRRGPPGRQPVGVRHWEQEAVRRQTAAQADPKHGSPSCRTASTRAYATGRCRRRGCERHGGGRGLGPWPTSRRCRTRAGGRGRSDPPLSMPGTASGRVGMCTPIHPPSGGRSGPAIPCGKAIGHLGRARPGLGGLGCGPSHRGLPRTCSSMPEPLNRRPANGVIRRLERGAQTAFPRRDHWNGSDPWRAGAGCENTPGPAPVPGPRTGGSLPSSAESSGAASPLRRPCRNCKTGSHIRERWRAHGNGVSVHMHPVV